MARKLRIEYTGAIYHVTVRSNGGVALFGDDEDRRYMLGRVSEAAEVHHVRVYMFCLMSNHFHMVVETPRGNLGRFMQGVLTGYGVYYNRRHRTHGHVTQGRYGARLVEGNEYLLKLSRYVHLNPVMVGAEKAKPIEARREALRRYPWSSFQAYAGLGSRTDFVEYEPVLALMEGVRKKREERYARFVEAGLAAKDEEWAATMRRSVHCIGSDDFREGIEERYRERVSGVRSREDISFRRAGRRVGSDRVLEVVAKGAGVGREDLLRRTRDCRWRAVAARMLCRHGGLTQREAARELGLGTGVAVSCQLKRLGALLESDKTLLRTVQRIDGQLDKESK